MKKLAIVAGLLCAGMVGASVIAPGTSAHGVYDWIRQKDYRALDGRPCCGIDDCLRIDPKYVSITADAYLITGPGWMVTWTFPVRHTLPSDDRFFWICVDPYGGVRCFFAPQTGV